MSRLSKQGWIWLPGFRGTIWDDTKAKEIVTHAMDQIEGRVVKPVPHNRMRGTTAREHVRL